MYVYNAAYSNTSTSKNYIQKSIYAEDDVKSMNRITCSELKTNNEQTDSWTSFQRYYLMPVQALHPQG